MPYVKNYSYQNMHFSSETCKDEFYTFSTVPELAAKSKSYNSDIYNCRTVGILHSIEGKFYLTNLDTPNVHEAKALIRVTMVYMKTPTPSVVVPYPIQIFGSLQWRNRPVIYCKILQVLCTQMAIQVRDTLTAVTSIHLAKSDNHDCDLNVSFSDLNDTFVLDST